MYSSVFESGMLLIDEEGVEYLILDYFRTGHQYDRHYGYSVLSEGRITEIDDYEMMRKKLRAVSDTKTKNGE